METFKLVLTVASFAVSGAVVALNGIAPLTKTLKDDKLRDFFIFLHDKVLTFVLPFLAAKVSAEAFTDNKESN